MKEREESQSWEEREKIGMHRDIGREKEYAIERKGEGDCTGHTDTTQGEMKERERDRARYESGISGSERV